MVRNSIPSPAKVSRRVISIGIDGSVCLADQMKLSGCREDLRLYFEIMRTVGRLCERYVPHNKALSKDERMQATHTIISQAREQHPILKSYKDAWPIPTMVNQHRQLRKGGSPRGIIRTQDEIASACRPSHPSHPSHPPPKLLNRPGLQIYQTGSVYIGAPPKGKKGLQQSQPRLAPTSATDDNREGSIDTLVSEHLSQRESQGIVAFLSRLAQDLTFLLPVFVSHGVGDEQALLSMVRLTNWRSWLYTWVKEGLLTELQFKMVCDGLEKLA